jgi:hypothetical protein
MAYGLKYELLCTSKIAKNAYTLQLLFDGYSASAIDRNIPASSPIVLRKDAEAVIRGTSLEFAIREEVDWEFDEFYTNNSKKIKAELYEDETLLWTGYVLPQQYQAPYIPVPLSVRFTATDGLGLLKNESFDLTGRVSQMEIIVYCIDKIGLSLDYSIAVSLFESNHDTALSPFEQTFEDAIIYRTKNCYEVLEAIIGKYDAEITQSGGQWRITSSDAKEFTRMIYDSTGVYVDEAAPPSVLVLNYPGLGDVSPVGSLNRSLVPGAKKITLSHNYGRKKSLLSNYDFSQYVNAKFTSWGQVGNFTTGQAIYEGKMCAFLDAYSTMITDEIHQDINIVNVPGEVFVFEFDFAPIGNDYYEGIGPTKPTNMAVRAMLKLTTGGTAYYLSQTEGWITTPTVIEQTVVAGLRLPAWNHLKLLVDEIPGDGVLSVRLYRYYLSAPLWPGQMRRGIWFSEPLVYFTEDGQLYPSECKMTATFDDSTEPEDLGEIIILVADAPDLPNNSLLYQNITRLSDDTPTNIWIRLTEESGYNLLAQLARLKASRYRIARQKLTGTLRGEGIVFDSIIFHAYNNNRKFEISDISWDLYEETYEATLIELLAWSSEEITFTIENNVSAGGSSATTGGTVIGTIGGDGTGPSVYDLAFQTPVFANPLDLDAVKYKNFKPGIATGNSIINVLNASDGDVGMIELIIDGTGGYTITMGNMFTKRIGSAEIDTSAGADNFIVWRKILDDYVYEVLGGTDLLLESVVALDSIDTASPLLANPSATLEIDYTLSNSGAAAGTAVVDWQITLDGDIVSAGSFRSSSVDPATPLEGTLSIIAPSVEDDYVFWMKMRTDETYTESINLTIEYLVVITGIDTVPDIANGCRYTAAVDLHNYTSEAIVVDLNWNVLSSTGIVISTGTYNDFSVPSGDSRLGWFIYLPSEPQEGCTLSLSILGGSPDAFASNEFAIIEASFNHVDTINDIAINNTLNLSYEVTLASECYFSRKAWIRDSTNNRLLLGYAQGTVAAGTSTLSHSILIPDDPAYIMNGADVEVAKLAEANAYYGSVDAIDSNRFNITA